MCVFLCAANRWIDMVLLYNIVSLGPWKVDYPHPQTNKGRILHLTHISNHPGINFFVDTTLMITQLLPGIKHLNTRVTLVFQLVGKVYGLQVVQHLRLPHECLGAQRTLGLQQQRVVGDVVVQVLGRLDGFPYNKKKNHQMKFCLCQKKCFRWFGCYISKVHVATAM